jgi:hypothetical protein
MRPLSVLLALAGAALIVAVIALPGGDDEPRAEPPRVPPAARGGANLWVDGDGGTCRRAAARSAYRTATACPTLDAAYAAARPGDRVHVRPGSYPDQRIDVRRRLLGRRADVVFRPGRGGRVRLGDLLVYGSNIDFRPAPGSRGFKVKNLFVQASTGRDDLRDVAFHEVDGTSFSIGPVAGPVLVKGGDWGPNVDPCIEVPNWQNKISVESINESGTLLTGIPTDITLDGLYIHDVRSVNLDECHTGGLMITGGRGITIRNTRFERVAVYDIQVSPTTDTVLENNWFGATLAQDGRSSAQQPEVQLDEPGLYDDWLIRHNSFYNGLSVEWDRRARHKDFRVIGNVGRAADCDIARGIEWAYNVWTDGRCSATDRRARRLPYESADLLDTDYHLERSVAEDLVAGRGADYRLRTDIDGDRRPAGGPRDAGSDER